MIHTKTRVMIAEDEPIMCDSLRDALNEEPDIEVVATTGSGRRVLPLVAQYRPDVIVLDLRMPAPHGLDAARSIRNLHPGTKVLIYTSLDDEEEIPVAVRACALAGVRGFLRKHPDDLPTVIDAVRALGRGGIYYGADLGRHLTAILAEVSALRLPPGVTFTPAQAEIVGQIVSLETHETSKIYDGLKADMRPLYSRHTIQTRNSELVKKLQVPGPKDLVGKLRELGIGLRLRFLDRLPRELPESNDPPP